MRVHEDAERFRDIPYGALAVSASLKQMEQRGREGSGSRRSTPTLASASFQRHTDLLEDAWTKVKLNRVLRDDYHQPVSLAVVSQHSR